MTIKDVAEMAGVSQSAVSRYLNGGSLSEEKRKRIRATISETGYRPAVAAQMLRTGRQRQVGVVVPRIYSEAVAQIIAGISDSIAEHGYSMVIAETGFSEERELFYISMMEESGAVGLVVMGTELSPERLNAYKKRRIPVVVTGQNISGVPCVYHDDFHAVEELSALVLEKHSRQFAYIGVDNKDPQMGKARYEGMLSACAKAGISEERVLVGQSDFEAASGYEVMRKLLKENDAIDGVVCATDTIAIGAMRALCEAGRTPGKDVGVAGAGGSWMDMYTPVPLTTAEYYYKECGVGAAAMLIKRIDLQNDEETVPVMQVCLDYKIVDRGSV